MGAAASASARRRRGAALGVALACALASRRGHAQQRAAGPGEVAGARNHAQLEYRRAAGAERCPDETALRAAVTGRLGYDPFDRAASTTVRAAIRRRGRGWQAAVRLTDAAGATGVRTIASRRNDCDELAGALSLAISIAIDPSSALRATPGSAEPPAAGTTPTPGSSPGVSTPAGAGSTPGGDSVAGTGSSTGVNIASGSTAPPGGSSTPPASAGSAVTPGAVSAPEPRGGASVVAPPGAGSPSSERVRARVGITVLGATGLGSGAATRFTGGLALSGGVRRGVLSLDLELRADLPVDVAYPVDSTTQGVRAEALLATLAPCYHVGTVAFCGLLSAGVVLGSGHGYTGLNASAVIPTAAVGVRVALELPLAGPVALLAHLDARYVPAVAQLLVDGQVAYPGEPTTFAAGLGVVLHFP